MIYSKFVSSHDPEHEKEWGRYNDSLPNLIELTTEQFAQSSFFIYAFTAHEFRQIRAEEFNKGKIFSPIKGQLVSVQIFYIKSPSEAGFILMNNYWDKTVRYFTFTKCLHEYKGVKTGNCLYQYTCTKCGASYEVDSSD